MKKLCRSARRKQEIYSRAYRPGHGDKELWSSSVLPGINSFFHWQFSYTLSLSLRSTSISVKEQKSSEVITFDPLIYLSITVPRGRCMSSASLGWEGHIILHCPLWVPKAFPESLWNFLAKCRYILSTLSNTLGW